jgi:hypothetical protein
LHSYFWAGVCVLILLPFLEIRGKRGTNSAKMNGRSHLFFSSYSKAKAFLFSGLSLGKSKQKKKQEDSLYVLIFFVEPY